MNFKRYLGTFFLTGGLFLSSLPLFAKLEVKPTITTTGLLIKVKPIVPSITIFPPIKINPPWTGTGIKTPSTTPTDPTTQLCNQCDPSKKPSSDIQCQNVDGNKLVSRCTSENTVSYISCGQDGKNTVNVSSCGEGEVCSHGACQKNSCSETPGGPDSDLNPDNGIASPPPDSPPPSAQLTCNNSYDAEGTVTGVSGVYSDGTPFTLSNSCNQHGKVKKYQCEGNQYEVSADICPGDTVCKDGACVGGSYACTDTDQNDSSDVQGVISVTTSGGNTVEQNFCYGETFPAIGPSDESNVPTPEGCSPTTSDEHTFSLYDSCSWDGKVEQLQCAGNHIEVSWQDCGDGKICKNGACQNPKASCTTISSGELSVASFNESDDGSPPSVTDSIGVIVIDSNGIEEDFYNTCQDEYTVLKYACSGTSMTSTPSPCQIGEKCIDGVCQGPSTEEPNPSPSCGCTDSDLNNDPTKVGEVVDIDGVGHHDYCNGNQLIQFACTEDGMSASKSTSCKRGCLNGACR